MKVAVIGIGYVGLPLALQFARSGVTVLGLDIDPAKVKAIAEGRSFIKHVESSAIQTEVGAGASRHRPIWDGSGKWTQSSSACPRP